MLVAGPWGGEFGWEVMGWQGMVRRVARGFEHVVVACRPDRRPLYEDFADQFLDVPNFVHTAYHRAYDLDQDLSLEYLRTIRTVEEVGETWMMPACYHWANQEWHLYEGEEMVGTRAVRPVLIHARAARSKQKRKRDYPREKWEVVVRSLMDAGFRVWCIGALEEAMYLEGAADLRGVSLYKVMGLMAGAGVVVGPTSGPIHLAALCGCLGVVTWGRPAKLPGMGNGRERVTRGWNPLGVSIKMVWGVPSPEEVVRLTLEAVRKEGDVGGDSPGECEGGG